MATKAERFAAALNAERARRNASARSQGTARSKTPKAHNLGERAGRAARVGYEASSGRPSRKSTRGSAHHQRATNQLERTHQLEQSSPEARAGVALRKALKVRGKP